MDCHPACNLAWHVQAPAADAVPTVHWQTQPHARVQSCVPTQEEPPRSASHLYRCCETRRPPAAAAVHRCEHGITKSNTYMPPQHHATPSPKTPCKMTRTSFCILSNSADATNIVKRATQAAYMHDRRHCCTACCLATNLGWGHCKPVYATAVTNACCSVHTGGRQPAGHTAQHNAEASHS
jgi:hypothetical protein